MWYKFVCAFGGLLVLRAHWFWFRVGALVLVLLVWLRCGLGLVDWCGVSFLTVLVFTVCSLLIWFCVFGVLLGCGWFVYDAIKVCL